MEEKKLLYQQITDDIRNRIVKNEYKSDEKLPTELDLAAQFGVSRITSKRALEELRQEGLIYRIRGSGTFVTPRKEEVQENMIKVDMSNSSKTIAIVIPYNASVADFMYAVRGACEVLNDNGFATRVYSTHKSDTEERDVLIKLYDEMVRGIVFYPAPDSANVDLLYKFYLDGFPIVSIDKYYDSIPMSYVVSDNYSGTYESVQYLKELGHTNIAFISDATIEGASSVRDRFYGYCAALKESGLPIKMENLFTGFNRDTATIYTKSIYESMIKRCLDQEITGVVAIDDVVASFLLRASIDLGVKVPEDLSIIGFDNTDVARSVHVPLTTISQDFHEMGRTAAKILIESASSNKYVTRKVKLPVELIIRESSAVKRGFIK